MSSLLQLAKQRKPALTPIRLSFCVNLGAKIRSAPQKRWPTRGSNRLPGPFLDFLDPWGNRIEIVGSDNIQFTKPPNVLRGMGLTHLSKNQRATKELTEKGMAPT
jgi:hypothetical protein